MAKDMVLVKRNLIRIYKLICSVHIAQLVLIYSDSGDGAGEKDMTPFAKLRRFQSLYSHNIYIRSVSSEAIAALSISEHFFQYLDTFKAFLCSSIAIAVATSAHLLSYRTPKGPCPWFRIVVDKPNPRA